MSGSSNSSSSSNSNKNKHSKLQLKGSSSSGGVSTRLRTAKSSATQISSFFAKSNECPKSDETQKRAANSDEVDCIIVPTTRRMNALSGTAKKIAKIRKTEKESDNLISQFFRQDLDDSTQDFQSPKKQSSIAAPKQPTKKPTKRKAPTSRKSTRKQPDIRKAINKNVTEEQLFLNAVSEHSAIDGVDPDQLQLAIALSRSLVEEPTADLLSVQSTQEKQFAVIQKFAFKTNQNEEYSDFNNYFSSAKSTKSQAKWKTKFTALTRRNRKKQDTKLYTNINEILNNALRPQMSDEVPFYAMSSEYLAQFHVHEKPIFTKNGTSEQELTLFYVPNICPISDVKCGCLLRDWSTIPGRDKTPERTSDSIGQITIDEKREIDAEHVNTCGDQSKIYNEIEYENLLGVELVEMPEHNRSNRLFEKPLRSSNSLINDNSFENKRLKDVVYPDEETNKSAESTPKNKTKPDRNVDCSPDMFASFEERLELTNRNNKSDDSICSQKSSLSLKNKIEPIPISQQLELNSTTSENSTPLSTRTDKSHEEIRLHEREDQDQLENCSNSSLGQLTQSGILIYENYGASDNEAKIEQDKSKQSNNSILIEISSDDSSQEYEPSNKCEITEPILLSSESLDDQLHFLQEILHSPKNEDNTLNNNLSRNSPKNKINLSHNNDNVNELNNRTRKSLSFDDSNSEIANEINSQINLNETLVKLNVNETNSSSKEINHLKAAQNIELKNRNSLNESNSVKNESSKSHCEVDSIVISDDEVNYSMNYDFNKSIESQKSNDSYESFASIDRTINRTMDNLNDSMTELIDHSFSGKSDEHLLDESIRKIVDYDRNLKESTPISKLKRYKSDITQISTRTKDKSMGFDELKHNSTQIGLNKSLDDKIIDSVVINESFCSIDGDLPANTSSAGLYDCLDPLIDMPDPDAENDNDLINQSIRHLFEKDMLSNSITKSSSTKLMRTKSDFGAVTKSSKSLNFNNLNPSDEPDEFDILVGGMPLIQLEPAQNQVFNEIDLITPTSSPCKSPPKDDSEEFKISHAGQEYFVKTENISPKPYFETMDSPTRLEHLKKYGLKPLARRKAIICLEHIYNRLHPFIEIDNISDFKSNKASIVEKPKAHHNSPSTSQATSPVKLLSNNKISSQINPNIRLCDENFDSFQAKNLDSIHLPSSSRSKKPWCLQPLHIAWYNLILSNKSLYEDILQYKPIDLADIRQYFKEIGLLYETNDMITFFDKHCITFRTENKRNYKKKPKLPKAATQL